MSPRLPRAFALLLGLGVLSSACSKSDDTAAPRPAGSPLPVARDASPSRADSLEAFRTEYTRAYLLRPDARLTLALSTLDSLLTGKPPSPVEARFQQGQWTFTSQGQPLGSLPEFPTFAQASELLEARVKQLGTQGLALQTDEAAPASTPPASPAPAAGTKKPVRGKPQKVSKAVKAPKAAKAPKVSKAPPRKVRGKAPAAAPEASSAFTPLPLGLETLQQLHSLDQDWAAGKRSALRVKQAARALAALSFQLVDLTEAADPVFARALAHLALARGVTGEPLTEERLLLATSLGYAREAHALAQTLPAGTPLRLYTLHEDGPLEALAQGEREPGLAGYLWERRLPEVGTSERERRLGRLEEGPVPTLQALTTRMRAHDFDADLALGSITPVLLLSELAASAGTPDVDARVRGKPPRGKRDDALERKVQRLRARFGLDQRGLMPAFEQELARVGTAGGFFLDAATERAWFQGLLFSAEYRAGLFLLDSLASPEDAARYVKELGQADSPAGREFLDWLSQLIEARRGQRVEVALMKHFTELKSFGAAPLLRVFEALEDAADWGDPAVPTMTRRLAARMDSRPEHRGRLGSILWEALSDVSLAEKLQRAAFEATDAPGLGEWLAWLDRDTAKLQALLDSPESRGRVRLAALEHLMQAGKVEPAALMDRLKPVLTTAGDDWSFISQAVGLLEQAQRYGEARELVDTWLKFHGHTPSLEGVLAHTALARLYQAEGKAAEGWAEVEPVIPSQQFGALQRAALLSQALGEDSRALSLAQAAAQRYPGPKSLSLVAEVHWRAGRPGDAASALANPTRTVRLMDWRWYVGKRFAAVFAPLPAEDGKKAFQALQKEKLGASELSQLVVEVGLAHNPKLAFSLQSSLRAPGLQQLELFMHAYGYMKQEQDEKTALAWLRATVPERMREPLCMFAFADKEDTVLWDVVPGADGTGETEDYVWLTRAAASVRAHDQDAAHQGALARRFGVDRPGFYHQLGRHLLGLAPQEAALAAATAPKSREELPFFLGLKAQAEGHYEDAVTWYRDAVETGNPSNGEYRWAFNELLRLRQSELSLAQLKQRAL